MTHKNYINYTNYLKTAIKAVTYMYDTIMREEALHEYGSDEVKKLQILEGNILQVMKTWGIFDLYYNNLHDTD